ncbi:MAG: hypothetical protein QM762_15745 [Chryseolinea sp.]
MKKLILLVFIAAACQTDDDASKKAAAPNSIIFGHFYGECIGEKCIEIYQLTDVSLFEDTNDRYPSSVMPYDGNFQVMDNSYFEQVDDLRNEIPAELLEIESTIIGQPDAADGGGIYFEIEIGGRQRYWLIDKMETNIPEAIRPFVQEIEGKIELLSK